MFQMTFSEEEIPMENNQNINVHTIGVPSPLSVCCDSKVAVRLAVVLLYQSNI